MWKVALQIVANLSAPFSKWWSNKIDLENSPQEKKREAVQKIDSELGSGSNADINRGIDDRLREAQDHLRRKGRAKD